MSDALDVLARHINARYLPPDDPAQMALAVVKAHARAQAAEMDRLKREPRELRVQTAEALQAKERAEAELARLRALCGEAIVVIEQTTNETYRRAFVARLRAAAEGAGAWLSP